jgi:hypothetical protein
MIPIRIVCVAALAASVVGFAPARAADRQPLVLDTQRGISDGQPGMVLQNAPLSRAPMVNAQSPARPFELAPDATPPIVVAPYVEVPGQGSGGRPPRHPLPRKGQEMQP